jgi:hypothetical protein
LRRLWIWRGYSAYVSPCASLLTVRSAT